MAKRIAFFVSDRTAITSETLGHSLLTQFDGLEVEQVTLRFVDDRERAEKARERINQAHRDTGLRPLVFSTLVTDEVRDIVKSADCLFVDFFDTFLGPLERELEMKSNHTAGRSHGLTNVDEYSSRIEAVNFTLNHDDGSSTKHLEEADIILLGISRTGKTPTCLYLSLHYGIRAANFPLTPDDLEELALPKALGPYRAKLFGLTTDPNRLQQIRNERLPNSRYASLAQCDFETRQAEALYRKYGIPYLLTTLKSVEEIAATIIDKAALNHRKAYHRPPLHT
ncbi:MAG TPA: pyruvate, water dikinase regulatory protein [Candidatus Competibacteraceae bacterium]|nr:pyruvate, water dikinase regulatory protein [Candidatus Competibacteraceae bacterium]